MVSYAIVSKAKLVVSKSFHKFGEVAFGRQNCNELRLR